MHTYELYKSNEPGPILYRMIKNGVEFGSISRDTSPDAPPKLRFKSTVLTPVLSKNEFNGSLCTFFRNENGKPFASLHPHRPGEHTVRLSDNRAVDIYDCGTVEQPGHTFYVENKHNFSMAVLEKSNEKQPGQFGLKCYELTSANRLPTELAALMLVFPLYRTTPFSPKEKMATAAALAAEKKSLSSIGCGSWLLIILLLIGLGIGAYKVAPHVLYAYRMSEVQIDETFPATGDAIAAYNLDREYFSLEHGSWEYEDAKPEEVRYLLLYRTEFRNGGGYYGSGDHYVSADVETAELTLVDRTTGEVIAEGTVAADLPDKIRLDAKKIKAKFIGYELASWASRRVKEYEETALTE